MDPLRRPRDAALFVERDDIGNLATQQVVHRDGIDLLKLLPVPTLNEHDSGPYISTGLMISRDPETGVQNVAILRCQISGPDRIGVLVLPRHTDNFYRKAEAAGRGLEVALVVGVDPACLLASQAIVPLGHDELEIAGALTGTPLEVVRCLTNGVRVPAEAEIDRLISGVRMLVEFAVSPHLNPNPHELFPASFSPTIKRLSALTMRNAGLTAILARLLDGPAPLRRLMLRAFTGGIDLVSLCRAGGELADYVRDNVFGVWHASGTCQMGDPADPESVVDPQGRVIGIERLTVVDASIMPRLPSANTNVPVLMAAEKIADALTAR